MACVVDMLHVAGRAVGLTISFAVTGGARSSGRDAIDRWIKCLVTTRTGEASLFVASNPGDDRYTLIVQRVKLITAPLLI